MNPILPFYPNDLFDQQTGWVIGTLVGIAFGFILERAGFGRARNLAAQFYLTDMRVLKVMFSAIVTACAGMALLGTAGVLDLAKITVPETFLWPQLVGGLLLGVGFIISGYCPGTAAAAASSGNLDGVVSLVGVMLGSLLFGFTYTPAVERFYKSGSMGAVTIHGLLGVPIGLVAVAVVAMAVGAFLGGEAVERIFAPRNGLAAPESPARVKRLVFAGFGVVAVLALALAPLAKKRVSVAAARIPEGVAPLPLAKELVAHPERFWVLDLRSGAVAARLPGAMALPAGDVAAAIADSLPATRTLLVYDQGTVTQLPSGVARWPGRVAVLSGGFDAWQKTVLDEPLPPENASSETIAELRLRGALRSRFTGQSAAPVSVDVRPAAAPAAAAPKKGGGC